MKTKEEIQNRINYVIEQLKLLYKKYDNLLLRQEVNLLSAESNDLRREINKLRGEVIALCWVLGEETNTKYLFLNIY